MNKAVIFTRLFSIFLAVVLVIAPLSGAISNEYSKSKALTYNDNIKSNETDVQIPENNSIKDKTEIASKENDPIQDEKKDENGKDKEISRQELKDRLGSLKEDPAYPLILKQHALENILSISSSENDRNKSSEKLDRARLHIEESIAGTLWYDETHLRSINEEQDDNDGTEIEQDDSSEQDDEEQEYDARTSVFRAEKKAAQNIIEAISKNKENTTYDDILIEAVENLVQADRNIAQTAITDAKRASSLYGPGLEENDDEENRDTEKAQKEFDKAVEKVQKGEPIDAIEHFEKAWEHAASMIFRLDAATKPVIVFDSINSRYINSTSVDLSGNVEDAAVYTISNLTLEVNGLQSTLDLNNGTFGTILSLNEGRNYINATAIDIFGNTGVNNVTLIVDTIPPVISYNGAEDGRYYNTSVSVTANMTDENPDTIVILVNGSPYIHGTPIIIEGTYRVEIRARDLAGNTAESSFTFHIDMTPPEIRIFQPANNSFISGTAAVNFTVKDASPVNTQAAVDGLTPVAEIFDSTTYTDGVHYIAVDAVKVSGVVGLFVTKYPSKAGDVGKVLAKNVLKYVPFESVKLGVMDAVYGGIVSALKKGDITADDLLKVAENNGDLGKTLGVVKRSDGSISWLEEGLTEAEAKVLGKRPSGWKHILEEHEDDFIKYGISGENEIKELIYISVKDGSPQTIPIEVGGGTVYILYVTSDKPITTIVGSNGYIVTSYPGLP